MGKTWLPDADEEDLVAVATQQPTDPFADGMHECIGDGCYHCRAPHLDESDHDGECFVEEELHEAARHLRVWNQRWGASEGSFNEDD